MGVMDPQLYRPAGGRALTIGVAVAAAALLVGVAATSGPFEALQTLPWAALVVGACWAAFVRARVEVSDGGVRLVNVMRTVDLPWPAITEVDTQWMLTLKTTYGDYVAWAAPMASRRRAGRSYRMGDFARAQEARMDGTIGLGDLPETPAGDAALLIRERWNALRRAGHLDNPQLEHTRAPTRWNWPLLAAAAALVAAGLLLVQL